METEQKQCEKYIDVLSHWSLQFKKNKLNAPRNCEKVLFPWLERF